MAKLFSTTISCCSQVLPEPVWASWNIFFTCLTLYMGPVTVSELFKGAGYSKLSFDSEKTLGLGDQSGTWDRVISNKMEVGIISIPVLDTALARCWGGGQVCETLETCKGVECTTQSISGGWEWKQQMCLRFCFQFLKGSSWSKQYDGCYGSCYLGPWDTPSKGSIAFFNILRPVTMKLNNQSGVGGWVGRYVRVLSTVSKWKLLADSTFLKESNTLSCCRDQ